MPSGHYRVVLNGFRCNRETFDDRLEWDGKHDEVFIASSVYLKDKTGTTLHHQITRSQILGDANNQAGRVQAGTASEKGGIKTGDVYPEPFVKESMNVPGLFFPIPIRVSEGPWERNPAVGPFTSRPPMLLWQGSLTRGENEVFTSPTIWEWDQGPSFWQDMVNWHNKIDAEYGQTAKKDVAKIWAPAEVVFPLISLGIKTLADFANSLGRPGDRPIGLNQQTKKFEPQGLRLTYDGAEALLSNDFGHGPGHYTISYVDIDPNGGATDGDYELFLQVERVPAAPQ